MEENEPSVPARGQSPPRRQQRKACDTCRRRKVRCDIVLHGRPCGICKKLNKECHSTAQWRTPAPRRRRLNTNESGLRPEVVAGSDPALPSPDTPSVDTASVAGRPATAAPRAEVLSDRWNHLGTLARNGLTQFFQRGIGSVEWLVFDIAERFRIGYVGTPVSNLAHLVGLRQPDHVSLHWPFPPIRPGLSWEPENGIWGLKGNLDIAQDLSCFPAKDIRDALVDAYFTKINPGFPVIDESKFRAQYADRDDPPPLLLFQSVLLAGAHVCDHPQVIESRAVVKGILFRRASMLYHLRHEHDRTWLMQAALLFSWHLEDADTVSGGSYYWLGVAHRIGFGMGMHRDLSASAVSLLPTYERRTMRRMWWTAFQWDVFSALEHGRPCSVNIHDVDQPLLEESDFIENEEEGPNKNFEVIFSLRNIELCFIVLDILRLNSPNPGGLASMVSINARLARWAMETTELYPAYAAGADFWSCQLRLHYNLAILHLHRNFVLQNMAVDDGQDSQSICNDATEAILACFGTITTLGAMSQCHFTATMALASAGIHMSNNIKNALRKGSYLMALGGLDRLSRLLRFAKDLGAFWPNAEAVYNMFEGLRKDFEANVTQGLQAQEGAEHTGETTYVSPDFQATLSALAFMTPTQMEMARQDWMNQTHGW
ncbi:hypothetical protein GQ53DRAFT_709484 [Thozetella sp. PMI_491]|nr:hypothetical protein GQ53DRAFT_709484 [Thozetella sp. PMI_491]